MTPSPIRLVHDATAPPLPRPESTALPSIDAIEPLLRRLVDRSRDGELCITGAGEARISVFEGKVAWIRVKGYPEHLGDVMRRELGLSKQTLRRVMEHCRETGQRFGEGMVGMGVVEPAQLRRCLRHHIADHLRELQAWSGPVEANFREWPHRYDHTYTFDLDEFLVPPRRPDAQHQRQLERILAGCVERIPDLMLACVVEAEDGALLSTTTASSRERQDLLGLCVAEARQLAANRVTWGDGTPAAMLLTFEDFEVVVHRLVNAPEWLLVLAGDAAAGRMLSVASLLATVPLSSSTERS